jgi:hypothetical protein
MNQIICPKCNGVATAKTQGHLEMIRCDHCGWTQSSSIYPESDVALIDESPESVIVQINWSSEKQSGGEVVRARQLFEQFGDIPLSQLLQQAKQSRTYTLGTYPIPIAIDLQERAKANGITVSFLKLDS